MKIPPVQREGERGEDEAVVKGTVTNARGERPVVVDHSVWARGKFFNMVDVIDNVISLIN